MMTVDQLVELLYTVPRDANVVIACHEPHCTQCTGEVHVTVVQSDKSNPDKVIIG
jgi:hypothetical protein